MQITHESDSQTLSFKKLNSEKNIAKYQHLALDMINSNQSTDDSNDEKIENIQSRETQNSDARFNSSQLKQKGKIDMTKFKTEMCRNFELHNFCQYGNKCKYAHGMQEINMKSNVNQFYRTRNCKLFHETGTCNYGTRCHFVHEFRNYAYINQQSQVQYQNLLNHGLTRGVRLPIFKEISENI